MYYIPLIRFSGKGKTTGIEIKSVIMRGWEWKARDTAQEHEGTSSGDGNVLDLTIVVVVTQIRIYQN